MKPAVIVIALDQETGELEILNSPFTNENTARIMRAALGQVSEGVGNVVEALVANRVKAEIEAQFAAQEEPPPAETPSKNAPKPKK